MRLGVDKKEEEFYSIEDWRRGYLSQTKEEDYWVEQVEGEIPRDLCGTLYRNGPGLLEIFGTPLKHPFDGDGMVCAFTFREGRCFFRNRFVKTQGFLEEQKAGRMLYRGVFGSQKPGGWLANIFDIRLKNIANTNVIYWGDKLLALWEADYPYCLNPDTLDTIGRTDLDGILAPGEVFSAHPRIDSHSPFNGGKPSLINFGVKTGLSSTITVYELDEKGGLIQKYSHIIPGFSFIHDFVITPNYCIFFQNPTSYNPLPFLLGLRGAGECVKFLKHKPTNIILIPRRPPHKDVITIEAEAGFIFHHANAFEVNEREIIVDSVCYEDLAQIDPNSSFREVDFDKLAPGQLWRFRLDLVAKKATRELIDARCVEFPSLHPDRVGHKYRYLFVGASHHPTRNAPLQALLKLDLETGAQQLYSFAPKGFAGEPIFVPRTHSTTNGEDDGWVLQLVYNSSHHRSQLVIFDGKDISSPVAVLHLKRHIPYGLHGHWKQD